MKLICYLTIALIISFFLSCVPTDDNNPSDTVKEIKADFGDCLENQINVIDDTMETIIEYTYQNNVLNIKHLQAGFNCCFDYILVRIEVKDNVIFIKEKDINPNCHCLCLRDIYYSIEDIAPGQYQVRVTEPYLPENDAEIIFNVDLKEFTSGTESFVRTMYPWVL
jgi:hypothetical protein